MRRLAVVLVMVVGMCLIGTYAYAELEVTLYETGFDYVVIDKPMKNAGPMMNCNDNNDFDVIVDNDGNLFSLIRQYTPDIIWRTDKDGRHREEPGRAVGAHNEQRYRR